MQQDRTCWFSHTLQGMRAAMLSSCLVMIRTFIFFHELLFVYIFAGTLVLFIIIEFASIPGF
jgi:hypothetical protein